MNKYVTVKKLLVQIFLSENLLRKTDLDLRHILVDTIENRNLGEVVEETSSQNMLEIIIEHPLDTIIEDDVRGLLAALGFNYFTMEYIPYESED